MSEEIKRIILRREYRDAPYETRYLKDGRELKLTYPARYATYEDAVAQVNTIPVFEYFDEMKSFDPMI